MSYLFAWTAPLLYASPIENNKLIRFHYDYTTYSNDYRTSNVVYIR